MFIPFRRERVGEFQIHLQPSGMAEKGTWNIALEYNVTRYPERSGDMIVFNYNYCYVQPL